MSILEMKEYLDLCLKGKATIPERKEILDRKLKELEKKIKELKESIDYIHWKQNFYNKILDGKRPYESNLISNDTEKK